MDWDFYEYDDFDPWYEWQEDPIERRREEAKREVLGEHEDRSWAEGDEELYLAALLYAGVEPQVNPSDFMAHTAWEDRVSEILILKFKHEWWYKRSTGGPPGNDSGDPRYRWKVSALKDACMRREHKLFYTWLCKQRKEQWTDRLVPY